MRTSGLLHARLVGLLNELGHTDTLVIADAGLPVPAGVERIDLALVAGVPSYLQTLQAILEAVESAIFAEEMSPSLRRETCRPLGDRPVHVVAHEELKRLSASARAVARTGECTPYANVLLVAGVTFR